MVATSDIATTITERVKNVPSSVASGNNVLNMVEDARIYVQNTLGVSISSSSVAEKYQGVIRNQAMVYVLMATHSSQSDYNVSAGDVNVSKADGKSPDVTQLEWYQKLVEQDLKNLKLENLAWGQAFYK